MTDRGLTYVEEAGLIGRALFVSQELDKSTGFSFGQAGLGDRVGTSGAVRLRLPFLSGPFKNAVTASHGASTRHYHRSQVQIRGGAYLHEWRPRDLFYGVGMDAPESQITSYAVETEQVRLTASVRWNERQNQGLRTELATWVGPRDIVARGGKESGLRETQDVFPVLTAATHDEHIEHLTYGARFASDWRLGRPHWTEGWRMVMQFDRFDEPVKWLALRTTRAGAQFSRATFAIESGISFMRDPRTIRVLFQAVDQSITGDAERMSISDLAKLGGGDALTGYGPGRFHDVDMVMGRISYIFPILRRFEMDLHTDGGAVLPDMWRDTRMDRFEYTYGFMLRGRTDASPIGAVGLDFSREGPRFRFTIGNPE